MSKTIWIINHYALTPAQGGLSRHFFFARELQKRGYNVRIFSSSTIHNTDINMIEKNEKCFFKDVDYEGVHYTYLKSSSYKGNGLARIKNMLGFAYEIKKIWKFYKQEKPDLIYASSPDIFTAWKAEKLAKCHGLPCVVEVRDLWPLSIVEYKGFSNHNPIISALYSLEKRIYKHADALVFTMEGGKDYLIDKKWSKKINLDKVFNINNGIDIVEQDSQRKDFIIDDLDLLDDKFKVVYTGSIRTANSVDLLVKAAEKLEKYLIKFIIYGDGDNRSELEQYCADNGIANVKFKGKVDKKYIPYICSKASINVLTYKNAGTWKYGGSQNKMFDYMNAGRPIVTNIQMGYSLLKKYYCGVELGNNEVTDLAEAILQIYNLPQDEYEQMCKNAKEAAKDFDYSILTDKLEEVINYAITQYLEVK